MSMQDSLPRAAQPFVSFATLLRRNGFSVAPEQTTTFLTAIDLLGPRSTEDIRRAGLATFAPPPERLADYNTLFRIHFLGEETLATMGDDEEETVRVQEEQYGEDEPPLADEINEAGQAAARAEALVQRDFGTADRDEALRRLMREAPMALPRRRSYRRMRGKRGRMVDLRRTLKEASRNDGEILKLSHLKRRTRQRKLLLLIDVSGSMKQRTDDNLRLAHALAQVSPRMEVFTFGTRLTRVSRPLQLKRREQALATASRLVSDWDGGTRIGDALQAFLAVPRFAGYVRGAAVLIISDGLERGDPLSLADAVARISRRAWRLSWMTPLAIGKNFKPQTEALMAIARFVDDFVDGRSTPSMVEHLLSFGKELAA